MLNVAQLREFIIKPALYNIKLDSDDAEELLIFTCANESLGGTYLKQKDGPALGIYQMEPKTYNDLWQNYIHHKSNLCLQLIANFDCHLIPDEERLIYDLRFATVMARIFYSRFNDPLPSQKDVDSIWRYYKKYYNTYQGKADKETAQENYYRFIRHN